MHTYVLQFADLSLPVVLCEPVTDMQRRGDFLEYVELLHEVSLMWHCGWSSQACHALENFPLLIGTGRLLSDIPKLADTASRLPLKGQKCSHHVLEEQLLAYTCPGTIT